MGEALLTHVPGRIHQGPLLLAFRIFGKVWHHPQRCRQEGAIGKLVEGDDGLLCEEVSAHAKTKREYLRRYVDISRGVRDRFIEKAGATYIDLFCGPGRSKIKETGEYIESGAVAAWNRSRESATPFTEIHVGDLDEERLELTIERLKRLNAPVHIVRGAAVDTVTTLVPRLSPDALHVAFLDPYNLALDFSIIDRLSVLKRIDILVHVSAMDLQRNLELNIAGEVNTLDRFAPGWRNAVGIRQSISPLRGAILEYWRGLVASRSIGMADMRLISGTKNQPLYWLLLAAKNQLALTFWNVAANPERQGNLFN